jgi:hypothetical protein
VNGGYARWREGYVETDCGQVSTDVGELRPIIHEWRVAITHPHVVIFQGLIKRSGNIDGCSWLGHLVGHLREQMRLRVPRGV